MTALSIQAPFPIITDIDGQPLEDGFIWIGVANLPPIGNPITVYWDAALTQPAALPVRTLGGYPMNSGTPGRLYVNSDYSILVQNKNGSTVYSAPAATERYGNLITFADITGTLGSDRVTFLQAGTGAVTRTAQSKMRDVVSVKDFGAVGDGVTDDTAAIQNAANAAQNNTLHFPPGSYVCANVTLPANITLTGDAAIKLKPLPSLNFSPIFNLGGSDVRIEGLTFDGNRANQPADGFSDSWAGGLNGQGKSNRAALFSTATATDLVVRNCEFLGFYAGSIALRNWSRVQVEGCYFHDSNFEGVVFNLGNVNTVQALNVSDCVFRAIKSGDATVNANCIITTLVNGAVIQNNNADDFERNLVKLETCSNVFVTGNKISNNIIAGFNVIQAQANGSNITISDNVMTSVKRGILVESGTFGNVSIIGNILNNVASASGAPDAIRVAGAVDAVIANNTINEVQRYGIYTTDCINLTITGNVIFDSSGTASFAAMLIALSTGVNGRVYNISNNVLNGKQDANQGIISLDGPGTYEAISICGNSLKGRGAANSRGFWSNSSAVFTNGIISNNVLASDCNIEMYPAAGSMLQAINNMAPQVVSPAGAFARIVGVGSAAPVAGTYYVGDILLHNAPAASGNIGWVCTTQGTPGTWKTFGAIAA